MAKTTARTHSSPSGRSGGPSKMDAVRSTTKRAASKSVKTSSVNRQRRKIQVQSTRKQAARENAAKNKPGLAKKASVRSAARTALELKEKSRRPSPIKKAALTLRRRKSAPPTSAHRKPRTYSNRSRLSDFVIGDSVIFRKVRDWNDQTKFFEVRGVVVGKGHDKEMGANYIEVSFDLQTPSGDTAKDVRRFLVK